MENNGKQTEHIRRIESIVLEDSTHEKIVKSALERWYDRYTHDWRAYVRNR